jgi:hypothetical protein
MTAKQYRAVIEHPGAPKTLEVIATGSIAHCKGALEAWASFAAVPSSADTAGKPLIVVEVTA